MQTVMNVQRVAVVGAGVSGVAAAVHLKRSGLDVTVYERSDRAGGVWAYYDEVASDATYPSLSPSVGDSPEWELLRRRQRHGRDSPMEDEVDVPDDASKRRDLATAFAPPGPCYQSLRNNVSTVEMEMTCQAWKAGTEEFVPHHVLADYIREAARSNGVLETICFDSRVDRVEKVHGNWEVDVSKLADEDDDTRIRSETQLYDAVVVASGHYHACNIPDIPGLADLKWTCPDRVRHSKLYRSAESFKDQTVLLIGGGVSSLDIAKDLSNVASLVIQSTRGGAYDLPAHLLPANAVRVGPLESFQSSKTRKDDSQPPSTLRDIVVHLRDGRTIYGVDKVIVCTGYHVSFPYMRQYHADHARSEDADEEVLVTDGQQTHNLHKDIWYIPDPTLAFVGVPYHVATFSAFEFQAIALAAVFSGEVPLLEQTELRREYNERLKRKGAGRTFHSLKDEGEEVAYVNELVDLVNGHRSPELSPMAGHTQRWHEAYARRLQRKKQIFSPSAAALSPRSTHALLKVDP